LVGFLHTTHPFACGRDLDIRTLACAPAVISIVPGGPENPASTAHWTGRIDDFPDAYAKPSFALLCPGAVRCGGTKVKSDSTPPPRYPISRPSSRRSLTRSLRDRPLSRRLLAEVLMASTYPLEVAQADRWRTPTRISRRSLKAALDKQSGQQRKGTGRNASVLTMMSTTRMTQKLGGCVLAQQPTSWTRSSVCGRRLGK